MRVYPRCVRRGRSLRFSSIKHVPDLARFIHRALPSFLSFRIESLVDALVLTGGSLGSSQDIATRLGLADRFSLCRLLRREGLPSYRRLRSWINILLWILGPRSLGLFTRAMGLFRWSKPGELLPVSATSDRRVVEDGHSERACLGR